jgi:hypothetical protein
MKPGNDLSVLAGKLTKGMRAAVVALSAEFTPAPRSLSRQSVAALATKCPQLCQREWQDGCAQCTYYRLTPLGIALKAYLLDEDSRHG